LAETAGPDPGTPLERVRLTIGTIVGPHGVRGELKLRLATDAPEHLRQVKRVFLGDEARPRRLLGVRLHGGPGQALLRVQGIGAPEAVDALRGVPVRIAGSDARPLEPGEFFLYQLIGLEAVDEAGTSLGRVTDVMETGAHDVFVVSPLDGGPDLLLPNHPEVVLDVRPAEGRMVVRPLVYE
jgi:16S rRNA processing protein RimM